MQHNFTITEHVITVDNKDTLPQIVQAKEKEVVTKHGNMDRKEKISRQANQHHHLTAIAIFVGSMGTSVKTADNFTRLMINDNGEKSRMMKRNQRLVESRCKMLRNGLQHPQIVKHCVVSRVMHEIFQTKIMGKILFLS